MNQLEEKYLPYNFSENRTHIISFSVSAPASPYIPGYVKIEKKLPYHIQHLTGIFISCSRRAMQPKLAGYLTLNFNGLALPCFQIPVIKSFYLRHSSKPYPLNEKILPNSYMQGYYLDINGADADYPYTINIYLHYKPIL